MEISPLPHRMEWGSAWDSGFDACIGQHHHSIFSTAINTKIPVRPSLNDGLGMKNSRAASSTRSRIRRCPTNAQKTGTGLDPPTHQTPMTNNQGQPLDMKSPWTPNNKHSTRLPPPSGSEARIDQGSTRASHHYHFCIGVLFNLPTVSSMA